MIVATDVLTPRAKARRYCIRLNISPAAREDAWDMCRVAVHYGGVEVQDCCFAFPNEERWLSALEALCFRFGPDYFEAVDAAETNHDYGETETPKYRQIELLSLGPVSRLRLLNHRPFCDEEIAELTSEWNSLADRADCRTLFVDCSNLRILPSDLLGKLILLHRRLKHKEGGLVLCGLRPEVRKVFGWTKLDQFLEIEEDESQKVAASALTSVTSCGRVFRRVRKFRAKAYLPRGT
jgi:anti-anti-sigma factor